MAIGLDIRRPAKEAFMSFCASRNRLWGHPRPACRHTGVTSGCGSL